MKKILIPVLVCISVFACGVALFLGVMIEAVTPRQYITSNLEEYGNYAGNYDNDTPREFINSFFPERIETFFSDIAYSYRAQKNDTYAFEAYLEFEIEDTEVYQDFIKQKTAGLDGVPFFYDSSFTEYVLSDIFEPINLNGSLDMDAPVHIGYAKIGKILCSKEEQRIIFVALGVYDGGVTKTDFLTVYFNRFEIDPTKYEGAIIR